MKRRIRALLVPEPRYEPFMPQHPGIKNLATKEKILALAANKTVNMLG